LNKGRSEKAVASIIAALSLISVAIAGGSVLYSYTMSTSQNLEVTSPNFALLEIPTGSANATTIQFYLLNIGKQAVSMAGNEKVYVKTPDGDQYPFEQISIAGDQILLACSCKIPANSGYASTVTLLPGETLSFLLELPFTTTKGYTYSILLVLGDGSETSATVVAN
jgi:hypothetical protein